MVTRSRCQALPSPNARRLCHRTHSLIAVHHVDELVQRVLAVDDVVDFRPLRSGQKSQFRVQDADDFRFACGVWVVLVEKLG